MPQNSKESFKNSIGRPSWWLINGVAIVLFIALMMKVWPEEGR